MDKKIKAQKIQLTIWFAVFSMWIVNVLIGSDFVWMYRILYPLTVVTMILTVKARLKDLQKDYAHARLLCLI